MVGAAAHGEPAQQAALALALRGSLAGVRVRHGSGRGAGRVAGGRGAAPDAAHDAAPASSRAAAGPSPLVAQGAGLVQGGAQLAIAPGKRTGFVKRATLWEKSTEEHVT